MSYIITKTKGFERVGERRSVAEYLVLNPKTEEKFIFLIYKEVVLGNAFYEIKVKSSDEKEEYKVLFIDEFPSNCGVGILSDAYAIARWVKMKNINDSTSYDIVFNLAFYFLARELKRRFAIYSAAEYQHPLIEYLNENWGEPIKLGRNFNSGNLLYLWKKDLKSFFPEYAGMDFDYYDSTDYEKEEVDYYEDEEEEDDYYYDEEDN